MIHVTQDPRKVIPPICESDFKHNTIIALITERSGYTYIGVARKYDDFYAWNYGRPPASLDDAHIRHWLANSTAVSRTWDARGHNLMSLLEDSYRRYTRGDRTLSFYICRNVEEAKIPIAKYWEGHS